MAKQFIHRFQSVAQKAKNFDKKKTKIFCRPSAFSVFSLLCASSTVVFARLSFVCWFVCLFVCLFFLFICSFVCLFVCLFCLFCLFCLRRQCYLVKSKLISDFIQTLAPWIFEFKEIWFGLVWFGLAFHSQNNLVGHTVVALVSFIDFRRWR